MKGLELLKYCLTKKYKSNREYLQTLRTLSSQLEEDVFLPLLEKAEKANKKLVIKDSPDQEIIDQYSKEDVVIV